MNPAIPALARAAVGALIKGDPSGLAIAAAQEAVGQILKWLPAAEKSKLDRLTAQVERELDAFIRSEGIGADLEPALGNATILFDAHGLNTAELVDRGLVPERATDALLARGAEVLKHAGKAGELCRTKLVPRVHQLLLNDPETITSLQPEITRALLGQREQIARLPDEVGAALRRMFGRWLVIDPREVWRAGLPEIYLLRAEYAVVPFHPERRPELDRLLAWCESEPAIAVRVITGPGGTGKTRLLIELCQEARRRRWRAGFLHRETPAVPSWELDGLVEGGTPLLLAVDYAETKREVLVPVLRRLALEHAAPKTRIILAVRALADWWRQLQSADPKLQEILDDELVVAERLEPIAEPEELRVKLLTAATNAFAPRLGRPQPVTAGLDLRAPHFANALFLHLRAFAVVLGDPAKEEDALLRFVLNRERRHWEEGLQSEKLAGDLDAASLAQALALTTLVDGAADKPDARELLKGAPKLKALPPPKLDRLIDLLHRLYPGERWLEPMRPDLLGEHLADQTLADNPLVMDAGLRHNREHTLIVLTRLAMRRPEAKEWLTRALGSLSDPVKVLRGMLARSDYRLLDESVETILRYHMDRLQKGDKGGA